jgi:DNA-binding NarL/FixJ family response regulator
MLTGLRRTSTYMPGILVVDDHQTVRRNIRTLLAENHVCVCGEAMDGEEALEKVRKLKPDIVLLDIDMPVMNGIQAAYEIRRMAPSTKVIFLTIHDAPETAAIMRLLADEFVCKSASGTNLIPIVRRLLQHQPESAGD